MASSIYLYPGNLIAGTLTATTVTVTGQVLAADGTAAAPSYSFTSGTNSGVMRNSTSVGPVLVSNGTAFLTSDGNLASRTLITELGWTASSLSTGLVTADVIFARAAANTLIQQNGNAAQEWRVAAGNGAYGGIITVNESLTILAAATTDSATTIPAGSIILGVSVRVTTVIPTAATFTMTAATGGTTFNTAAVSTAATSTDKGTAAGALYTSAGTKVRITPNATPATGTGVVRLAMYYFNPLAPTS